MPSVISHPAIPLGLATAFGSSKIGPRLLALGVACSVLPDLDAIGYRLGVPYAHLYGHRGFSHSIVFALLVAAIGSAFHRPLQASRSVLFPFLFVCTFSHGVLDALTTGGLGIAFFSPFSNHRYFLPWRVIEVSPLGVTAFFSHWGLKVLCSEVQWVWGPSFFLAALGTLVRRRAGAA